MRRRILELLSHLWRGLSCCHGDSLLLGLWCLLGITHPSSDQVRSRRCSSLGLRASLASVVFQPRSSSTTQVFAHELAHALSARLAVRHLRCPTERDTDATWAVICASILVNICTRDIACSHCCRRNWWRRHLKLRRLPWPCCSWCCCSRLSLCRRLHLPRQALHVHEVCLLPPCSFLLSLHSEAKESAHGRDTHDRPRALVVPHIEAFLQPRCKICALRRCWLELDALAELERWTPPSSPCSPLLRREAIISTPVSVQHCSRVARHPHHQRMRQRNRTQTRLHCQRERAALPLDLSATNLDEAVAHVVVWRTLALDDLHIQLPAHLFLECQDRRLVV